MLLFFAGVYTSCVLDFQEKEEVERNLQRKKHEGKERPLSPVDLPICHDFMWSKWKGELGYVYSTVNLSFKPKDLATLKM